MENIEKVKQFKATIENITNEISKIIMHINEWINNECLKISSLSLVLIKGS